MWAESSDIHIITYKKFCSKLKSVIFLDWPILCVELWTSKKTAKRDVVTIHLLFVDTSWLFLYFFIYTTWALNTINDLNRPRTFFSIDVIVGVVFSVRCSVKYGRQFAGVHILNRMQYFGWCTCGVSMVPYEMYKNTEKKVLTFMATPSEQKCRESSSTTFSV